MSGRPLRTFPPSRSGPARFFSCPRCSVSSSFNAVSSTFFVNSFNSPSGPSGLTRAKLVRDARGDGVEDGLRVGAGWGGRNDLVPVDADRDVAEWPQHSDHTADAGPGDVLQVA